MIKIIKKLISLSILFIVSQQAFAQSPKSIEWFTHNKDETIRMVNECYKKAFKTSQARRGLDQECQNALTAGENSMMHLHDILIALQPMQQSIQENYDANLPLNTNINPNNFGIDPTNADIEVDFKTGIITIKPKHLFFTDTEIYMTPLIDNHPLNLKDKNKGFIFWDCSNNTAAQNFIPPRCKNK